MFFHFANLKLVCSVFIFGGFCAVLPLMVVTKGVVLAKVEELVVVALLGFITLISVLLVQTLSLSVCFVS